MSVCLAEIRHESGDTTSTVEVWASDYDADELALHQGDLDDEGIVYLSRKQLEALSKVIDRFMDR